MFHFTREGKKQPQELLQVRMSPRNRSSQNMIHKGGASSIFYAWWIFCIRKRNVKIITIDMRLDSNFALSSQESY